MTAVQRRSTPLSPDCAVSVGVENVNSVESCCAEAGVENSRREHGGNKKGNHSGCPYAGLYVNEAQLAPSLVGHSISLWESLTYSGVDAGAFMLSTLTEGEKVDPTSL